MASVLFFADIIIFWRSRGFPFKTDREAAAESSNGGPVVVAAPPEMERLNTATTTAE